MKKLLFAAILLSSFATYAQVFKKGYLVNDDGVRTECLIKQNALTKLFTKYNSCVESVRP